VRTSSHVDDCAKRKRQRQGSAHWNSYVRSQAQSVALPPVPSDRRPRNALDKAKRCRSSSDGAASCRAELFPQLHLFLRFFFISFGVLSVPGVHQKTQLPPKSNPRMFLCAARHCRCEFFLLQQQGVFCKKRSAIIGANQSERNRAGSKCSRNESFSFLFSWSSRAVLSATLHCPNLFYRSGSLCCWAVSRFNCHFRFLPWIKPLYTYVTRVSFGTKTMIVIYAVFSVSYARRILICCFCWKSCRFLCTHNRSLGRLLQLRGRKERRLSSIVRSLCNRAIVY